MARAPLLLTVAKNGKRSDTPLSGAATHQSIRRRAERAGYDPTALAKLDGHSLRAGFVTQGTRNGAYGSSTARLDSVEALSPPSAHKRWKLLDWPGLRLDRR